MKRTRWVSLVLGAALVCALVSALDRLLERRKYLRAALVMLVAGAVAWSCFRERPIRVGTYNIRDLGVAPTDMARLAGVVIDTRADVLAIQEIRDAGSLDDLARRTSAGPRRMRAITSACGGQGKLHVGFLYDAGRVDLVGTQEFPGLDPSGKGPCEGRARAALAATFRAAGARITLLAIHLKAGGTPADAAERRAQWDDVFRIVQSLRARDPAATVVALGDANSTGFLDDRHGERTALLQRTREADLVLTTQDLACSEYFQPTPERLVPSLLDQAVATPGRLSAARVHGYCAELRCLPHPGDKPEELVHVSDHCPVTMDLTP